MWVRGSAHRAGGYAVCIAALLTATGGCVWPFPWMPAGDDSSEFVPLSALENNGEAVVRLYGTPILNMERLAIHAWFVVKSAEEVSFDRWEVWATASGPYGYVRLNLRSPASVPLAGRVFVIAELIGPEAEPVIEFIETQSPNYPCRDCYLFYPGPNCNTYVQWVLDSTGWAVTLPPTAIGQAVPPDCP